MLSPQIGDDYEEMFAERERFQQYQEAQALTRPGKRCMAEAVVESVRALGNAPMIGIVPSDTGVFYSELARLIPRAHFVLVDRSSAALEAARAMASWHQATTFVQARAEDFPRDLLLDAVVIPMAIHLLDSASVLSRLSELIGADGLVLTITKTREQDLRNPMALYAYSKGIPRRLVYAEELGDRFESAGLRIVELRPVRITVRLALDQIPVAFSRNSNSFLHSFPEPVLRGLHGYLSAMARDGHLEYENEATLVVCESGRSAVL